MLVVGTTAPWALEDPLYSGMSEARRRQGATLARRPGGERSLHYASRCGSMPNGVNVAGTVADQARQRSYLRYHAPTLPWTHPTLPRWQTARCARLPCRRPLRPSACTRRAGIPPSGGSKALWAAKRPEPQPSAADRNVNPATLHLVW